MKLKNELKLPKWLRDLERLLSVRRQFVLEGNIRDEVPIPLKNGSFEPMSFKLALQSQLRMQYPLILFWNQVSGMDIFPMTEEAMNHAASLLPSLRTTLEASIATLKSMPAQTSEDKRKRTQKLDELCRGIKLTSLEVLSDLVQRLAVNNPNDPACALVIDYASRIVNRPNNLDTDEMNFFRACEKSANEAASLSRDKKPSRYNPVIWLCNRAQDLPSWFLLDSPNIHTITCATPDLDTRLSVAHDHITRFYGEGGEMNEKAARILATQTEGMRLSALGDIVSLAKDAQIALADMDDAVKSYQLGDLIKDSPWRSPELRARIRNADRDGFFTSRVKGQSLAIIKVLDMLKRSVFGLTGAHSRSSEGRPKGIMFFAGPTGVGKTEMAKTIAAMIFENEHAVLRFDMSEFSAEHSDARLIGAPPGYVGYEVGGELTNALRERPYRVILFDEIEKAHPRILDKFLQILEDGRLTDGRGETVYFSESIIIFTSNLGIYVDGPNNTRVQNVSPETKTYDEVELKVKDAIMDHFRFKLNRPEILNRIGLDNIVVFNFIQKEAAREIFSNMLSGVLAKCKEEQDITIAFDNNARKMLEDHCIADLNNGGRGIGSRLEGAFTNSLTRALFDCEASAGSSWCVTEFGKNKEGAFFVKLENTNS